MNKKEIQDSSINQSIDIGLKISSKGPKNLVLAYVSDLHLDYRLNKDGISLNNVHEIRCYFQNIILRMYRSIPREENLDRKILFLGDISHNFDIYKVFF